MDRGELAPSLHSTRLSALSHRSHCMRARHLFCTLAPNLCRRPRLRYELSITAAGRDWHSYSPSMASSIVLHAGTAEFPFHVRSFHLPTDYDACVELIRLSMHSIRVDVPGSDVDEQVEPAGIEEAISGILTKDMQPGEAGIPAHYIQAPNSGFWVAVATQPTDQQYCLPDTSYPFIAGMLALRPSRACDDHGYAKVCSERGLDFDKEATLNRVATLPKAQRRGVSRALLKVAEDTARANGFKGLHLGTAATGRAAVQLYLNNGFTVVREAAFPVKIATVNASTGKEELVEVQLNGLEMRKAI